MVCADRKRAWTCWSIRAVDVVLSDDGLAYPCPANFELLVLDAERAWVTVDCCRGTFARAAAASRMSTWYLSAQLRP
ncbi:MAG: hypothetical protein CM15mP125_3550 [Gammaproteobacteria bacterium]|nr:MAG: hypothetical protein CM15mP125_3550 [Gammaproteobacteria bacterium]